ncbi:MAG: hypothetical protein KY462_13115 [Actinobacteria bacterium]|nr:hypothetical protein [Actinomycetota bacterium]
MVFFPEHLIEGTVGFARSPGLSTFLIAVVFLGFHPENLAVGVVGSVEGATGIVLATILGQGMIAIALAFGLTALIVPLRFQKVPRPVLAVPVAAALMLTAVAMGRAPVPAGRCPARRGVRHRRGVPRLVGSVRP